jgi:hypothetical protein
MDRSYLSQPAVIAAARPFVCVRLTTYENKDEGDFLKGLAHTRSGELENSVFTILAPDGHTQLARASRSTKQTFGDAQRMAATMNRIAGGYRDKQAVGGALPTVPTPRLAVNVAACDSQPLVVVFATDPKVRRELEDRLRPLAWGERFIGRFVYAVTADAAELTVIDGPAPAARVAVAQPGKFGLSGTVLAHTGAAATPAELEACLADGLAKFHRDDKTFANHVRQGHLQGVFWETVTPVTDPEEQRARERGRRARPD